MVVIFGLDLSPRGVETLTPLATRPTVAAAEELAAAFGRDSFRDFRFMLFENGDFIDSWEFGESHFVSDVEVGG